MLPSLGGGFASPRSGRADTLISGSAAPALRPVAVGCAPCGTVHTQPCTAHQLARRAPSCCSSKLRFEASEPEKPFEWPRGTSSGGTCLSQASPAWYAASCPGRNVGACPAQRVAVGSTAVCAQGLPLNVAPHCSSTHMRIASHALPTRPLTNSTETLASLQPWRTAACPNARRVCTNEPAPSSFPRINTAVGRGPAGARGR